MRYDNAMGSPGKVYGSAEVRTQFCLEDQGRFTQEQVVEAGQEAAGRPWRVCYFVELA